MNVSRTKSTANKQMDYFDVLGCRWPSNLFRVADTWYILG